MELAFALANDLAGRIATEREWQRDMAWAEARSGHPEGAVARHVVDLAPASFDRPRVAADVAGKALGGTHKEVVMARCEVCGNDYDKALEVTIEGSTHTFDSFECAIHALAPTCGHCGCRIIGHGVEANGRIFCCAHCASEEGISELRDRA